MEILGIFYDSRVGFELNVALVVAFGESVGKDVVEFNN